MHITKIALLCMTILSVEASTAPQPANIKRSVPIIGKIDRNLAEAIPASKPKVDRRNVPRPQKEKRNRSEEEEIRDRYDKWSKEHGFDSPEWKERLRKLKIK